MAFWFQDGFWLDSGQSIAIEYWFNGFADVGAQVATPVPFYSDATGVVAVNQGIRYDRPTGHFIYMVGVTNFGPVGSGFQLRGGGLT
jgi:hypothetical protein